MTVQLKSGWRATFIAYAPLFLWIGLIFFLSSDQGSLPQTSRFIRPLLKFLIPAAPEETLLIYHGYIRKTAHFVEYAILGLLACRAFLSLFSSDKTLRWIATACGVVLTVACLDELNQSLSSARSGSLYDVILDLSGGLTAIAAVQIFRKRVSADG